VDYLLRISAVWVSNFIFNNFAISNACKERQLEKSGQAAHKNGLQKSTFLEYNIRLEMIDRK
jgi:hypothetical protein